jgi:hypothetical protein
MLSKVGMLALVVLGSAQATTYTFTNVFPNDGHLIGDPLKFAIKSVIVDVTSTQVKVTINENYDNANLNPFTITTQKGNQYTLAPGDFFFTSTAGVPLFGVALKNHGGTVNGFDTGATVTANNLYQVTNASTGLLTSDQVMNKVAGDDLTFNSGINVWLHAGSGIALDSNVTVNPGVTTPLATVGNGTTTPLYSISFTINRSSAPGEAFNQLMNGAWGFQIDSADCANDYFSGTVPEPATLSFMALGLAAMSLKSRAVRTACRRALHLRSN